MEEAIVNSIATFNLQQKVKPQLKRAKKLVFKKDLCLKVIEESDRLVEAAEKRRRRMQLSLRIQMQCREQGRKVLGPKSGKGEISEALQYERIVHARIKRSSQISLKVALEVHQMQNQGNLKCESERIAGADRGSEARYRRSKLIFQANGGNSKIALNEKAALLTVKSRPLTVLTAGSRRSHLIWKMLCGQTAVKNF